MAATLTGVTLTSLGHCGIGPIQPLADSEAEEKRATIISHTCATVDLVISILTLLLGVLGITSVIAMPPVAAYALLSICAATILTHLFLSTICLTLHCTLKKLPTGNKV